MSRRFHLSRDVAPVREAAVSDPPALVHPGWVEAFPWLVQGTTTRGGAGAPFDLGLFSNGSPEDAVRRNWGVLRTSLGARRVLHARQVHGSRVRIHGAAVEGGANAVAGPAAAPTFVADCDGHVTDEPGVLLAVTTADCVPVFAVDGERRVVGVFHAGWRGASAGVVERGLEAMTELGSVLRDVQVHLGPSVCGACYEVGPEVFEALGREAPATPTPIDLRAILAERAISAGVPAQAITVSSHCTRCTGSGLFSHRGGDAHRQVGYLGIRS